MADAQVQWEVVAEPVGANPALKPEGKRKRLTGDKDDKGKDNVGGVVIYVAYGTRREEVARVGFVRATSENPGVDYETQLDETVKVARKTADTLNQLKPDGALQ